MKKTVLVVVLLFTISFGWAQKNQKIAFIDMEYILESVPEYLEGQNTLNEKLLNGEKN